MEFILEEIIKQYGFHSLVVGLAVWLIRDIHYLKRQVNNHLPTQIKELQEKVDENRKEMKEGRKETNENHKELRKEVSRLEGKMDKILFLLAEQNKGKK